MIIRDKQLRTLHDSAASAFEAHLVDHSHEFAPRLCAVAGRDNVRKAVRMGLTAGGEYRFKLCGPLRYYIEMMLSFGSYFDTDPQLPWIATELQNPEQDELLRADALFQRMNRYCDEVMGPDNEYALAALRKAAAAEAGDYDRLSGSYQDKVRRILSDGFPEKALAIGERGLEALLSKSVELGSRFQAPSERQRAFFVVLMFSFGHGVVDDPLYPWVGATLRDPLVEDPADRVTRLQRKVRTYAERALESLEEDSKGR